MGKIIRVGVTFPSEPLSDFDKIIRDMGYGSSSKAIHDTVRAFVNEQKWLAEVRGSRVGAITMVYNHEMRGLESDPTDTQHHFETVIYAAMHVASEREKVSGNHRGKGTRTGDKQLGGETEGQKRCRRSQAESLPTLV